MGTRLSSDWREREKALMNAEIGSILVYCAWNCADGGMSSPSSVEDKHKVANLTFIPKFLPEITIGAHEYDESYYKFKSVCMARCGTGTGGGQMAPSPPGLADGYSTRIVLQIASYTPAPTEMVSPKS